MSTEDILERVLELDIVMKGMLDSLKTRISHSRPLELYKDRIRLMSYIVKQQPSREMDVEEKDFLAILTPVLLKVFEQMNCSLNQFYNLLTRSYFWSVNNCYNKSSLDRIISEVLRGYEVKQDFATRINSQSVLVVKSLGESKVPANVKTERAADFFPICPLSLEEDKFEEARGARAFEFERKELVCCIEQKVEPAVERISFEKRDLIWVKHLSRAAYKAVKNGNAEFIDEVCGATERFLKDMAKKYGSKKMLDLEGILPTYFIKALKKDVWC